MSESDWLRSHDVSQMLDTLAARGDPPEHKLRLFALACARRVAEVQTCPIFADVLAACERHADDVTDLQPLFAARRLIAPWDAPMRRPAWRGGLGQGALARVARLLTSPHLNAEYLARSCRTAASGYWGAGDSYIQADILRDIVGNPFAPAEFRPEWRTSTAAALAAAIHRSGNCADLPILADALEDAGCDAAPVLDHLRAPGYHVRGCWAVDLALNPSDTHPG